MELIEIENRLNEMASAYQKFERNYTGEKEDRDQLNVLIQKLATDLEIVEGEYDCPMSKIQLPESAKRSIIIPKASLGDLGKVRLQFQ